MRVPAGDKWPGIPACLGSDIDFTSVRKYADRSCDLLTEEFVRARAVCRACPVIEHCYRYAMSNDVAGLVAGTTEHERAKLRKRVAA